MKIAKMVMLPIIIMTFLVVSFTLLPVQAEHIVFGDLDGDGVVSVSDAIIVLRSIVGLTNLTKKQEAAADVNQDGVINVADAITILRYIVGLVENLPTVEATEDTIEDIDSTTLGEKNALNSALDYLKYKSFSYSGLVEQLKFEGYTHEEAIYGVDNCGADWNEQAALKAQEYLDYSSYSRAGLIAQLEFEGFTRQQAEYGVEAVGY